MSNRNDDYDLEPVKFCPKCYSLKVKYDGTVDSEYCGECGCTDIQELPFEVWEQKYEGRYKHKFAERNSDPKQSFVFNMSLEKLKEKVYKSPKWKQIIRTMFPNFPEGLDRADSVILFFDTVIRQNKINELRLLLFKTFKY